MRDRHEPAEEFVRRLEAQIGVEVRRRSRLRDTSPWPRWMPHTRVRMAMAIAALVLVSMGLGGGVVATAYQVQSNQQRSLLLVSYQNRVALATQRLTLATEQVRTADERASLGTGSREEVLEARFKVAEAEAQLESIRLQLAEVQISGREPQSAVTSPLVSGRDFVTDRWRAEMAVPTAAFELGRMRLEVAKRRFDVGMASNLDVDLLRVKLIELEAAIEAFRSKLDIRQRFLKREMDAQLADLRVLEAEAKQRRAALVPRVELEQRRVRDLGQRVEIGTAHRVEVAEAQMRLQELSLELSKADLDLLIVREQIAQHR